MIYDKPCSIQTYNLNSISGLIAQLVKNPSAMKETLVQFPGGEDPLEEGMATYPSILAWRIPMDRGVCPTTVHGVTELEATEQSITHNQAPLVAQLVKNLPAMQETGVRFLGRKDPLEKEQATHSSVLGLPLWLTW